MCLNGMELATILDINWYSSVGICEINKLENITANIKRFFSLIV